jgi:hypothetical protein
MTDITQARLIGNHAAMGGSTPAASDTTVTVKDILRAGVGRRARRKEMAAAQSTWDSEGGASERRTTAGQAGSTSLVPRAH